MAKTAPKTKRRIPAKVESKKHIWQKNQPRTVMKPRHLVKSMLVQKAKAVTMKTVTQVMPAAMKTDSMV